MKKLKKNDGFTLLEIIIAIGILGIITVSLLSLFSSGLRWIYSAGDKGVAHSESRSDIETRLATGESEDTDDLSFDFNGIEVNVSGGIVESTQEYASSTSRLSGFSPMVETLRLSPDVSQEGYNVSEEVFINHIDAGESGIFGDAEEINVELLDKFGVKLQDISYVSVSDTSIKFELPTGINTRLTNDKGYYIVRTIVKKDGETTYSRAKLFIQQPNYIAAGNEIFVSSEVNYWIDRKAFGTFPSVSETLSSGDFGRGRYVFAGENGVVLLSGNEEPWTVHNIGKNNTVTGLVWSGHHEKFFAVDDEGYIYESTNGSTWSTPSKPYSDIVLKDIAVDNQGRLVAVGHTTFENGDADNEDNGDEESKGVILSSANGSTWNKETDDLDKPLYGVTAYSYVESGTTIYNYIAVGKDGAVIANSTYNNWGNTITTEGTQDLRDVHHSLDRIVVVGDGVVLIKVNNGTNWTSHSVSGDLYSVDGTSGQFVMAGVDRAVYHYKATGSVTQFGSMISGEDLYVVVAR